MVDSARVGEQGRHPGCCEHALLERLLVDGGFVEWRELVDKECFRASLCSDTSYLNAPAGWWIRAKAGPMTIDSVLTFLCKSR